MIWSHRAESNREKASPGTVCVIYATYTWIVWYWLGSRLTL